MPKTVSSVAPSCHETICSTERKDGVVRCAQRRMALSDNREHVHSAGQLGRDAADRARAQEQDDERQADRAARRRGLKRNAVSAADQVETVGIRPPDLAISPSRRPVTRSKNVIVCEMIAKITMKAERRPAKTSRIEPQPME